MFYRKPGKLQGIGKIQYPSRVIGISLAALVYGVNQFEHGTLLQPLNVGLITTAILYPHIALYIYWKSNSNRKVESNMLLVDALFSGIAIALMGFNLLPSIIMGSFTAAGTMVAKGWKHFLKGLLSIGFGMIVGLAFVLFDLQIQFHNELNLIIACCIFVVIYTALFSFAANSFVVQIIKIKRLIGQQQKLIEEQHKDILDSINYAKRIQNAILPNDEFWQKNLPQSFVLYIPKDVVAGDFYWMYKTTEAIYIAAADCTGHGVPGAMVSVVCNNCLNRSVREFGLRNVNEILDRTRELVISELSDSGEDVKDGMDISMLRIKDKSVQYSGAHNPLWILRNGTEEIEEIKADKQPVGKFDKAIPFTAHNFSLETGDQLYLFSDGFSDQFGGEQNKKYKSKRLKKYLSEIRNLSITEQHEALHEEFQNWKGELEQLDDVCVIGIEF